MPAEAIYHLRIKPGSGSRNRRGYTPEKTEFQPWFVVNKDVKSVAKGDVKRIVKEDVKSDVKSIVDGA